MAPAQAPHSETRDGLAPSGGTSASAASEATTTSSTHPAAGSSKRPSFSKGKAEPASPPAPAQKRQKFSRSRTACLQCRSRKSKCGALPPDPCPNCVEADLPCQWPTEDGRSSKARLQRYRTAQLAAVRGQGSSAGMVGRSGGGIAGIGIEPPLGGGSNMAAPDILGAGWLDRLLAGDSGPGTGPMGNGGGYGAGAASTPSFAHAQFASPMNAVFPPGLPFSPTTAAVTNAAPGATPHATTTGSHPNTFQVGDTPTPFLDDFINSSTVDPAQFVWAVSGRLPTVEEGSPNDERSVASDPSPAGLERVPRLSEARGSIDTLETGAGRSKDRGKIVKVSWWRPHGQTAIAPGLKKVTLKVRVHTPEDSWRAGSGSPAVVGGSGVAAVGAGDGELITAEGYPSPGIMRHLLDVFMTHFGCQFPFISRAELEQHIGARTGSVFLLLSIAAIAARFSTHPAIALPHLQPYEYGNVFYSRAKQLLGSTLGVPSREAVAAFILLAHMGFAADSECEVWMMTGLAVRMSIDMGLHLDPPDGSMSDDDKRLNRLVFWSVLLMDYALSFGVGRQTAFRPEDITQTLPTQDDLDHAHQAPPSSTSHDARGGGLDDSPRSPFPFACKMMLAYGPLINGLNRGRGGDKDVHAARAAAIREYSRLPPDMQWNVANLQRHSRTNHGPIFLHLHLWLNTILASGYLTGSNLLSRSGAPASGPGSSASASAGSSGSGAAASGSGATASVPGKGMPPPRLAASGGAGLLGSGLAGTATPNTTASTALWRNSARTIGDILVLSDIINPHAYFAIPFTNQAWFVAGCCYIKEIEQHAAGAALHKNDKGKGYVSRRASEGPREERREQADTSRAEDEEIPVTVTTSQADSHDTASAPPPKSAPNAPASEPASDDSDDSDSSAAPPYVQVDLSRALLTSVATTNITTLQQGLSKLARYWYGAEWIAGTLAQRIEGIHDVDLVVVRENFDSYVSLPDAGLAGAAAEGVPDHDEGYEDAGHGHGGQYGSHDPSLSQTQHAHAPTQSQQHHTQPQPQQPQAHVNLLDMSDDLGLDLLSLPFDVGAAQNVTEQEVPLPHVFPSWAMG